MSDLIASARNTASISEGQYNTVGLPANAITPATITAMMGLAQGGALQVNPVIGSAISTMTQYAATLANTNPTFASQITSAATALATQSSQLMAAGPAGFGTILNQAAGHIKESVEVKKAMNFMANTNFSDFGSGITSMSSLATQGVDTVLGNLGAASKAFSSAGSLFDSTDMKNFGTSVGLINQMKSSKLANSTGLNSALVKAGVDITKLDDPTQASKIDMVMSNIKDPAVINSVANQFDIKPAGTSSMQSLKDFTDITKLANPADIKGLSTDLTGIGSKLGSMGASFKNPAAASNFCAGIEVPNVPKLNDFAPDLAGLMSKAGPVIDNLVGTGTGKLGVPSMEDFMGSVSGTSPAITNVLKSITPESIAGVQSMVTSANSLFQKAGIDLTSPPKVSASTVMAFATSLHKIGADSVTGAGSILKSMATNDAFGEAVKASLAEGKNKAVMAASGISPLSFTDSNPFAGLPSDPTSNAASTAANLLGS